jgi:hypothetical protein
LPVFVECKALHANDVVDDPAANPSGLFSSWSGEQIAGQVTEFLDTHPEVWELLQDEGLAQAFFERYEEYRKREQTAGTQCRQGESKKDELQNTEELTMAEEANKTEAAAGAAAQPAAAPAVVNYQEQAKKYQTKFGTKAIDYLAAGLSYEQALEAHVDFQNAEQAKAKQAPLESAPVPQSAESLSAGDAAPQAEKKPVITMRTGLEKAQKLLEEKKFSSLGEALKHVYKTEPELKPVPPSFRG